MTGKEDRCFIWAWMPFEFDGNARGVLGGAREASTLCLRTASGLPLAGIEVYKHEGEKSTLAGKTTEKGQLVLPPAARGAGRSCSATVGEASVQVDLSSWRAEEGMAVITMMVVASQPP